MSQRSNLFYRIERDIPVGAYLFQEKEPWSSAPHTSHPNEIQSKGEMPLLVKYKKLSEESETEELIKNSDRLPYCFTIRSRYRENSLTELFKRKPLMTTLKNTVVIPCLESTKRCA